MVVVALFKECTSLHTLVLFKYVSVDFDCWSEGERA